MLMKISSSILRDREVEFHQGLNVVQGDLNATNSIGKSSLLMMVDFAFGGSSLMEHNKDIVTELGHHTYFFEFCFDQKIYNFSRDTSDYKIINQILDPNDEVKPLTISEYSTFLKNSYIEEDNEVTFRQMVSLYSRIWGKENLNVKRPLHTHPSQNATDCIDGLIKTFNKYSGIKALRASLRTAAEKKKAMNRAFKNKIIPKINKTKFKDNLALIEAAESEMVDIESNLQRHSIDIREIVGKEMAELMGEKDDLISVERKTRSQLQRVDRNLTHSRHVKGKFFEALSSYFPSINQERLENVESFHSNLSKALKAELIYSKSKLEAHLDQTLKELGRINASINELLEPHDNPAPVVNRIYKLSSKLDTAERENHYYEENSKSGEELKLAKEELSSVKKEILKNIESDLNSKINEIMARCFDNAKKSPVIEIQDNTYGFEVFEDTGTGTAYSSMIVLDLAVFSLTGLPILIHDSLLFKNIENNSVSELVNIYAESGKQSFVALDEIMKYGSQTASLLESMSCIKLSDDHVLTVKDWR